jgi:quercetin dioxygenase-like cupin family protein
MAAIDPAHVRQLLEDARKSLLPATGSRPGQRDFVASSPAGGQFVLVQVDGVCDVEEHVHEYDEYCLVLQGRVTTWMAGEAYVCDPGDFLFEPANIPHRARIEGPYVAIDFFAGPRFTVDEQAPEGGSD